MIGPESRLDGREILFNTPIWRIRRNDPSVESTNALINVVR